MPSTELGDVGRSGPVRSSTRQLHHSNDSQTRLTRGSAGDRVNAMVAEQRSIQTRVTRKASADESAKHPAARRASVLSRSVYVLRERDHTDVEVGARPSTRKETHCLVNGTVVSYFPNECKINNSCVIALVPRKTPAQPACVVRNEYRRTAWCFPQGHKNPLSKNPWQECACWGELVDGAACVSYLHAGSGEGGITTSDCPRLV